MGTIFPVIVCIAKSEENYIEEFVKYHLALGFSHIYIYDNEDNMTYNKILEKYLDNVSILHTSGNNYVNGIKYMILEHFKDNILFKDERITHAITIDIDEFIVLKKHKNITEFIEEYIKEDCQGIGINRVFFGSSGEEKETNEPITQRFIKCSEKADKRIKTLYNKTHYKGYGLCYNVLLKEGTIRNTRNEIIYGSNNINNIDLDIIQINKYKIKSYEEFKRISKRGKSSLNDMYNYYLGTTLDNYIEDELNKYDINEKEDITAKEFYKNNVINKIV